MSKVILKCPKCIYGKLAFINSIFWQCGSCHAIVVQGIVDCEIGKDNMTSPKKVNFTRDMALKNLKLRSELFNRIPSVTNMILTFEITDAVILQTYKLGGIDPSIRSTEKTLERYEKCKNLALGNQSFNERKLAFNRTLELFYKVIGELPTEEKENKNA